MEYAPILHDARGMKLSFDRPPQRIVSLIPSITEALFEIGAEDRVVGVSNFCDEPAAARSKPRVGGQKNPDFDRLAALQPDLVILNLEENKAPHIETLASLYPVWVTYPRRMNDAAILLQDLGRLLGLETAVLPYVKTIEHTISDLRGRKKNRFRTLYLIWHHPWMSINQDTFIHDVLFLHGLDNVCAEHPDRYGIISVEDITRLNPEVIILPDEPFHFREKHLPEIMEMNVDAVRNRRIFLVEGSFFCWYGTRSARCSPYIVRAVLDQLPGKDA